MSRPVCKYHADRMLSVLKWLEHMTEEERRLWLETYARSCCSSHCRD